MKRNFVLGLSLLLLTACDVVVSGPITLTQPSTTSDITTPAFPSATAINNTVDPSPAPSLDPTKPVTCIHKGRATHNPAWLMLYQFKYLPQKDGTYLISAGVTEENATFRGGSAAVNTPSYIGVSDYFRYWLYNPNGFSNYQATSYFFQYSTNSISIRYGLTYEESTPVFEFDLAKDCKQADLEFKPDSTVRTNP